MVGWRGQACSCAKRLGRGLGPGLAAAVLAGCAHYAPSPTPLDRFPAAYDTRRLEEKPLGDAWTGADLLSAALAGNPAFAEATAKMRAAALAVAVSRVSPPMALSLTGEYARETPHMGHGGALDIPVDVGARRSTRITQAQLQALQALYDDQEAVWTVRTALARARADLVGSDAEIALAAEVVALRQQRADRLETRVSAGEDNRFLAYTARTELVVSERRLAEAQARRDLAATALAKALGVSPAAVQRLPLAPPPPAALSGLPQWRREAALYRRDVLRAVADYDLAENALRLEVAKQYPDVHLAPAYNWDHGVLKLPFGLAMTLPPTDLNRASIRQAEAARAAAGRSLETVQANALAGVDAAAAALVAAQANLERARDRDVPNAERVMESTERGLRLGAVDRTDDLAARAALGDVRLNLMDAERAYRLAIADLEDTLHHVFDPVEAAVLQAQTDIEGDAR